MRCSRFALHGAAPRKHLPGDRRRSRHWPPRLRVRRIDRVRSTVRAPVLTHAEILRSRALPDVDQAQHQRTHPAAVPICRIVKHGPNWGATLSRPEFCVRQRFMCLPLREIRNLRSGPDAPSPARQYPAGTTRSLPVWLSISWIFAVTPARILYPLLLPYVASAGLVHGSQPGLASQGWREARAYPAPATGAATSHAA
jgi:hypothetical protein